MILPRLFQLLVALHIPWIALNNLGLSHHMAIFLLCLYLNFSLLVGGQSFWVKDPSTQVYLHSKIKQ